jgi:enoyl-CoA hydratase/carnithine racemase
MTTPVSDGDVKLITPHRHQLSIACASRRSLLDFPAVDTNADVILVQQDGPIATVIFNRPRMRNAISYAMWGEIARVTEGLSKDDAVRAIVFRGAGTDAFASGADISEFKEHRKDTATALHYNAQSSAAYTAIRDCPKPTVAMIFGYCMGGAMAVAMACDLRFAAEGSKFGIPAAKLSIIYGADAVGQLVELVGPAYAKDILYSARTVTDREALAMGFIQRLVPAAELERTTFDYLRAVAANAPLSVRGAKVTVQSYVAGLTDERRKRLHELSLEAFESEDYKEGTRAFLEKRPPRFQGR